MVLTHCTCFQMHSEHYHDKAGLRQPVEDALRDHDRTKRLSSVKSDYNRLFELQVRHSLSVHKL